MENIDMFKSNHERRMRYSIRKFSVGVASVAVASLFMGSVVHATEKEGSTQAATFLIGEMEVRQNNVENSI